MKTMPACIVCLFVCVYKQTNNYTPHLLSSFLYSINIFNHTQTTDKMLQQFNIIIIHSDTKKTFPPSSRLSRLTLPWLQFITSSKPCPTHYLYQYLPSVEYYLIFKIHFSPSHQEWRWWMFSPHTTITFPQIQNCNTNDSIN